MKKSKIFSFRRIIQAVSLFLVNGHFRTFLTGGLYRGNLKGFCIPVLNCFSCPLALTTCPIGAIQQFLMGGLKSGIRGAGYILGLIGIPAVFLGRFFCGWICPFGFLQDLIGGKRRRFPVPLAKTARVLRFVFLFGFVLILPVLTGHSTFCRYICPAGILEAGVWGTAKGYAVFSWVLVFKILVFLTVLWGAFKISRLWCRICPLGLFLGFFNKVSFLRLRLSDEKLCDDCGVCTAICPMNLDLPANLNSISCIRCGDCVKACPKKIIKMDFK